MKYLLIIIAIATSSFFATGQTKNKVKGNRSKIKNGNVLIVPDQKPVIIERREEPVNPKDDLPPGKVKKVDGAKSARPFAHGHSKKTAQVRKNKRL